ncbi:histidine phosphotransferase ChpT [Phenylobacterium immobile]|uniref:histidine phosphotransferase ChpT n=1 Tax=Phenylobacterium immobile TaxID=21 RepID=UPI000A582207|nr:histidine phosphotransferase family protein [Phenylobacterium immobile]
MPSEPIPQSAAEFAAVVAARLCHDFLSPASAIVSGLDLLDDPQAQDMRSDALGLIAESARKLVDLLAFYRIAFGASAAAQAFSTSELGGLTRAVFTHAKAELDWSPSLEALPKPAARVLLNLTQMAGAALPMGGLVRVRADVLSGVLTIAVEATGPKTRLREEVSEGLNLKALGEGMSGPWAQATYAALVAAEAGGRIVVEAAPERITFGAALPS